MYYILPWWGDTHPAHWERGTALCNALASLWQPSASSALLLPNTTTTWASSPQQQALYYYSHAWLTPGLPAVHQQYPFGAIFFTTDLRPAVRQYFTRHWGGKMHATIMMTSVKWWLWIIAFQHFGLIYAPVMHFLSFLFCLLAMLCMKKSVAFALNTYFLCQKHTVFCSILFSFCFGINTDTHTHLMTPASEVMNSQALLRPFLSVHFYVVPAFMQSYWQKKVGQWKILSITLKVSHCLIVHQHWWAIPKLVVKYYLQ